MLDTRHTNRMRFNTQPPEGGWTQYYQEHIQKAVSTHSRLKAAARLPLSMPSHWCFNTQPPEGGCFARGIFSAMCWSFNTQPPEGGCHIRRTSV